MARGAPCKGGLKMDWAYLLTSFEGRIGRKSYWLASIVLGVFIIIAELLDMVLGMTLENGAGILTVIASLLTIYPSVAIYAKRWHDRGKSGWWTLILLVPVIGAIWMLVECGFLRGTDGDNQYGPDPLRG
jgi:uncharacterized membrane protein YhaH (DUF805 family)